MRKPKKEYFQERMEAAKKIGNESKAEYYKMRLESDYEHGLNKDFHIALGSGIPSQGPGFVYLKEKLRDWVSEGENNLSKSIVHTPTEEYLMSFMDANKGSSDPILMQMAIQYGINKALEELKKDFEL